MTRGSREALVGLPEQNIVNIPLSKLRLWSENPRDPLDGQISNKQIIAHALHSDDEGRWSLRKLARQMGPHYDMSDLPTVVPIEDGPDEGMYRVYDGNRRVILALLQHGGFPEDGEQFQLPLVPDCLPCNVCNQDTALEHVLRRHSGRGTWGEYERDLFMHRYMGAERSVLVRLQELVGAMGRWPKLNQRFVKEDVLNNKHLQEMGLDPELEEYGVSRDTLIELLEAIANALDKGKDGGIDTRTNRNNPVSVLPAELLEKVSEDRRKHPDGEKARNVGKHTDLSQRRQQTEDKSSVGFQVRTGDSSDIALFPAEEESASIPEKPAAQQRRTRQIAPKSYVLFGCPLLLRQGEVNNIYRTLDDLWNLNERGKVEHSEAFVAVIRMGLRLLAEKAAQEMKVPDPDLNMYVKEYAAAAKSRLRQREDKQDLVTYLESQSIAPDTMIRRLQSGAHGYTSTNNRDQAIALSILLGQMLVLSHGK